MHHNRIREYRERLDLTQEQLAKRAGIGRNTVWRYERTGFDGRIDSTIKEQIAAALQQSVETIFSTPTGDLSRRQLFSSGASLTFGMAVSTPPLATMFGKSKSLNGTEIQSLIDSNHATWMLLDSVQQGTTVDYVNAVAQGNLVALNHLAQNGLPEQQKQTVFTLLGDMHILLGRLNRDRQNFASAEEYFQTAIQIADQIHNSDLRTAAMHRYGNMLLLDQGQIVAAVRNADGLLIASKTASHPLWAEAQLMAGMAYAYIGRFDEARRLASGARGKQGADPAMWVGNITNPKAMYADFDLITNLAEQRYHEAYQASLDTVSLIEKEYPDTIHWRLNVEVMQAQALWGLGGYRAISGSGNSLAYECSAN